MKIATFTIDGISPYQQGRHHDSETKPKESKDAWEQRTWHNRAHVNDQGEVYIPAISLKICLAEAAKFLNKKVEGEGKSTWTKHFESGLLVTDDIYLGIKKDEMVKVGVYGNSQGRKGQPGGRVWKYFPTTPGKWKGEATVYILDDKIYKEVFEEIAVAAGQFIGLGVFRPKNGGTNGRFKISNLQVIEA